MREHRVMCIDRSGGPYILQRYSLYTTKARVMDYAAAYAVKHPSAIVWIEYRPVPDWKVI